MRLIISQRLEPTVEGKRVALREYLVFNEKIRDILLEADVTQITHIVRRLVREYGKTIAADAFDKYQEGLISERQYHVIAEQAKREESSKGI